MAPRVGTPRMPYRARRNVLASSNKPKAVVAFAPPPTSSEVPTLPQAPAKELQARMVEPETAPQPAGLELGKDALRVEKTDLEGAKKDTRIRELERQLWEERNMRESDRQRYEKLIESNIISGRTLGKINHDQFANIAQLRVDSSNLFIENQTLNKRATLAEALANKLTADHEELSEKFKLSETARETANEELEEVKSIARKLTSKVESLETDKKKFSEANEKLQSEVSEANEKAQSNLRLANAATKNLKEHQKASQEAARLASLEVEYRLNTGSMTRGERDALERIETLKAALKVWKLYHKVECPIPKQKAASYRGMKYEDLVQDHGRTEKLLLAAMNATGMKEMHGGKITDPLDYIPRSAQVIRDYEIDNKKLKNNIAIHEASGEVRRRLRVLRNTPVGTEHLFASPEVNLEGQEAPIAAEKIAQPGLSTPPVVIKNKNDFRTHQLQVPQNNVAPAPPSELFAESKEVSRVNTALKKQVRWDEGNLAALESAEAETPYKQGYRSRHGKAKGKTAQRLAEITNTSNGNTSSFGNGSGEESNRQPTRGWNEVNKFAFGLIYPSDSDDDDDEGEEDGLEEDLDQVQPRPRYNLDLPIFPGTTDWTIDTSGGMTLKEKAFGGAIGLLYVAGLWLALA